MRLATTLLNSVANQGALFRSLRLRSGANAYLGRTPASAGNRQTWTYSAWVKRGSLTTEGTLLSGGSYTGRFGVFFDASGRLISDVGGTGTYDQSSAVFRDPSAWYHFVWTFDTTQASAANRSRMYINGSQIALTQTRTFSQNTNYNINSADLQTIGVLSNSLSGYLYDGCITEINFVDGQALTPSSFGRYNQQTGVWEPSYFKGTFGTNGYYLPFTNTASTTTLGYDLSGNGNNWTTNNFSLTAGTTYDSFQDVPTLTSPNASNYCTWNPLTSTSYNTLSNSNLTCTGNTSTNNGNTASTFAFTTGMWYAEMTVGATAATVYPGWGITLTSNTQSLINGGTGNNQVGFASGSVNYNNDGGKQVSGAGSSYGASWGAGDVIGIAVDATNGAVYYSKNGVWQNSGVPTSGASKTGAAYTWTGSTSQYSFATAQYNGSTCGFNWGQQPFAYTPPTGYKSLNTYNLSSSSIVQGGQHMSSTLYTGNSNGGNNNIATGFAPDFSWLKSRTQTYGHYLFDTIRGNEKYLNSNSTGIQGTESGQTFTSTGFTLNTSGGSAINESGQGTNNMISWNWKGGGTAVSNTNGSVTSQVSVNPTAGFSVVQYVVPSGGSTFTWGHGLPATPQFIILKGGYTTTTYNWDVYHASLGPTVRLVLNSSSAQQTYSGPWNDTSPTSTVVSQQIGWYASGDTNIAYCWTPVEGFSKFGSYTGTGSADGPFIYCGFRPAFVMTKMSSGSGDWYMWDDKRIIQSNGDAGLLYAQANLAESDYNAAGVDLLSNGFKIRNSDSSDNNNGSTMVYAAFAENPFKNALAR